MCWTSRHARLVANGGTIVDVRYTAERGGPSDMTIPSLFIGRDSDVSFHGRVVRRIAYVVLIDDPDVHGRGLQLVFERTRNILRMKNPHAVLFVGFVSFCERGGRL